MNELEVLINAKTIIENNCKDDKAKVKAINYISELIHFLKEKESIEAEIEQAEADFMAQQEAEGEYQAQCEAEAEADYQAHCDADAQAEYESQGGY